MSLGGSEFLLLNGQAHNWPLRKPICAARRAICAACNGEYVDHLGIDRRLRALPVAPIMEIGARRPSRRAKLRGHLPQNALAQNSMLPCGALTFMAPNPRARARGGAERRAPPADRPAIRATRWRRLLAAVADSVLAKFGWGRTLELGRSLRTLMMLRPPVVCDSAPVNNCVEGAYGRCCAGSCDARAFEPVTVTAR